MARVVPGRLDSSRDERVMGPGRHEVSLEQRPGTVGVALGQGQKGEVTAPERGRGIRDDGPESGNPPAGTHQRGGRRVLPALELRHAEGHEMQVVEGAASLQYGE